MKGKAATEKRTFSFMLFMAPFAMLLIIWGASGCSRHPFPFNLFPASRPEGGGPDRSAERLFRGRLPHNLVLITIDTLRADHLGCYGNPNARTPAIDALAKQGILFRQAFSPVPLTLPSHASILTGLYPPVHGLRDNGYFILNEDYKTLAEVLKENGYTTGAIVASFVLNSRFGLDQGFDFYEDTIDPDPNRSDPFRYELKGDKVLDLAKEWLVNHQGEKFFLWLHFYDPHDPYDPPEPQRSLFSKGGPRALYDGEIAYTDACLGQFIGKMDELNLRDNTLLVLTADHGEGLGEHGEKTHGIFIYDSTLQVPLIISNPGLHAENQSGSQSQISQLSPDFLVRTIDILPTTLGLLGLVKQGESYGQGVNLLPWLLAEQERRTAEPDLKLYAESLYTKLNFDWSALKGIRSRDWKYIQAPTAELYRVSSDPGETENILLTEPKGPDIAGSRERWEKYLQEEESGFASFRLAGSASGAQVVNDREIRQRLESLGYLCAPRKEKPVREEKSAGAQDSRNPLDPKDMVEVLDSLDQGQTLYAEGKLESAARQFEAILELDPGNIFIHYLLGDVYSRQGDFRTALSHYQAVLQEQEDYLEVQNKIGSVYDHLEEYEKAIEHFQKAATLYPDQPRAYINFGIIYIKTNRLDEAQKNLLKALDLSRDDDQEKAVSLRCLGDTCLRMNNGTDSEEKARQYYQQALKLKPDMIEVFLELARYYTSQRRYSEAIPNWEKVISLQPQDNQAAFALGQCYLLSGDRQKAEQLFRQCLQIQPDHGQARSILERLEQGQ
ncbi:MAG: sulfatase-like hydrolase/transferase [bacterium]